MRSYLVPLLTLLLLPGSLFSQEQAGGEANLVLPDLSQANFFGGAIGGRTLLLYGLLIVALGLLFGLVIYHQLKNLPVHKSMLEISELIYETCKTYLVTQGKFLVILEVFIGVDHRLLLRRAAAFRRDQGAHHSDVQRDRHLRQLRRGVVRHSREHFRQLAHRVRQPARQAVSRATTFRSRRA